MAIKLSEHTYGGHIYMKMMLPSGRIAEIDVSLHADGLHYRTTADHYPESNRTRAREEIIAAFHALY